jgi:hypothetical protein
VLLKEPPDAVVRDNGSRITFDADELYIRSQ